MIAVLRRAFALALVVAAPTALRAQSALATAEDEGLATVGFYQRQALGRQATAFLTRADIHASGADYFRELFYGRKGIRRGVQGQWSGGSRAVLVGRFGGAFEILLNGWSVPANGVAAFAPVLEGAARDDGHPGAWDDLTVSERALQWSGPWWDAAGPRALSPWDLARSPYVGPPPGSVALASWDGIGGLFATGWQRTPTVDELVALDVVQGVEIYWDGQQVPPELRRVRLADGPLMVIWTGRGGALVP